MSENESGREVISFAEMLESGRLEEDILWTYHVLGRARKESDLDALMDEAPTPGAAVMLDYAFHYKRDFIRDILPKALNRKGKEMAMRDDGRKKLEIFGEIYSRITEEFETKRKCPLCDRALGRRTVLFRRPQKSS